jgi:hypothetical protein
MRWPPTGWPRRSTRHPRAAASRRSGASSPGQVNPGEVLITAVNSDKPKMLSGLNQKVCGWVWRLNAMPARTIRPPVDGGDLTCPVIRTERGKPVVSRRFTPESVTARRTQGAAGSSSRKKPRPFCNGMDTGPGGPARKGADVDQVSLCSIPSKAAGTWRTS